MKRRAFLKNTGLLAASASASTCSRRILETSDTEPANKPNIIVILLDDMGYSDIGCFGSEIQTPNLDRMASEGVRFTQFYNTARCCPSRATIMTGLYPHQAGVGHMISDWGLPGYQGHLGDACITIPEALQTAGYRTIMSGKWHLGTGAGDNPWERGFERFYGIPKGGGVYFWPTTLDRDIVRYHRGDGKGPVITEPDENFYTTDAFTDYAIQQIHLAQQDRQPFFMYLPYVTPHWPHQAWEKDVQKYTGKYKEGWEKLRRERYRRQVEMGIIDPKFKLPDGDSLNWGSLTEKQKTDLDRQMAVYAAQIDNLDQNVGKIMEALRQTGIDDDTLTIFLSDNGGQPNSPLGDEQNPKVLFGTRESLGKYAKGWGNMSNTPFRRYKYEEHEGGNATPLILRWPGGIQARGEIREQPGHIIDIVPTCLDAAGLDPAFSRLGEKTQKSEGISLLPFSREKLPEQPRTLCWESGGNRAVRAGDWKLVALEGAPWELYNIREDRTELHDLTATHPQRVKELVDTYQSWASRCNVLPWPVEKKR